MREILRTVDYLDEQLADLDTPGAIVGVGVAGSGKTTILAEYAKKMDILRVSPDEIRERMGGDYRETNAAVWAEAHQQLQNQLYNGESVIVDATNTYPEYRQDTIRDLRTWGAAAVAAVVFRTPVAIAKQRNALRENPIPEADIDKMNTRLQAHPPTVEEGFDRLVFMP